MGKGKTQTQTQSLDPASQGHVNRTRQAGVSAYNQILNQPGSFFAGADPRTIAQQIRPFMNPYTEQVIGGLGNQFDRLRKQATVGTNQDATFSGAFNSARHGVAEGERLSALDRAQAEQVGGFLSNQFNTAMSQGLQHSEYLRALRERQLQEPLFRQQQANPFLSGTLGPTGETQTTTTPGNFWGDVAGLGLMGASLFAGGPAAAANIPYRGLTSAGQGLTAPRPLMDFGAQLRNRQISMPNAYSLPRG